MGHANLPDLGARRLDLARAFADARPDVRYLLPGLVQGTPALLVGPSGVSKSFLALQTAVSIGLGEDVWHLWTPGAALPQGRVVVVSLEDPENIVVARMHDIAAALPLTAEQRAAVAERVDVLSLYGEGFRVAQRTKEGEILPSPWMAKLSDFAARAILVVIDTFNLALGGGLDENSSGDMGAVVSIISAMCRSVGCSCLVLHHTNKASSAAGGKPTQDATRGSTAIVANARWQTTMSTMDVREAKARRIPEDERRRWVEVDLSNVNYGPSGATRWLYRGPDGVLDGRRAPPPVTASKSVDTKPTAAQPPRMGSYRDAKV